MEANYTGLSDDINTIRTQLAVKSEAPAEIGCTLIKMQRGLARDSFIQRIYVEFGMTPSEAKEYLSTVEMRTLTKLEQVLSGKLDETKDADFKGMLDLVDMAIKATLTSAILEAAE